MSNSENSRERPPLPLYGGPGRTAFFASQYDQRFSYCLYVPRDYEENASKEYALCVIVHGSLRNAEGYRDQFADFADENSCIVLAPLFPRGIIEPADHTGDHNYKFIKFHDIRYDHVLLSMVDEIAGIYRVKTGRFLLYGFSGGGHFAHRFFYLHPERLRAVSIGAPGTVTLLDQTFPWWVGVKDIEDQFGVAVNLPAMREVAVQMIVGCADTVVTPDLERSHKQRWMPGADRAGANRVERLNALRESFEAHGIGVDHVVVPDVGHKDSELLPAVKAFFASSLRKAVANT